MPLGLSNRRQVMYQDTFITIEHGKEYQARKESIYDKNAFFSIVTGRLRIVFEKF